MDAYISTMDKIGNAILQFSDPENKFTGFTKVCLLKSIEPFNAFLVGNSLVRIRSLQSNMLGVYFTQFFEIL